MGGARGIINGKSRIRGAKRIGGRRRSGKEIGNAGRGRDAEIGRFAEEVPAVAEFAGETDVVAVGEAVNDAPRQAALDRDDGVDLPAFEQVRERFDVGQLIGEGEGEAVADVDIGVAPFGTRIEAILGLLGAIQRGLVD